VDLNAAFPDLVAHHADLVYGVAVRLTRSPADAEDLAQEAFTRAFRALRGYPPERIASLQPRGWLAAIVGNLARDRARRAPPPTSALDDHVDRVVDGADPEGTVIRREADHAWQARLAALPGRYGLAVALRHVEGLSYPELAAALGRPLGTVKSDVHRGVEMLREALAREADASRSDTSDDARASTGPRNEVRTPR
jgi:RNA polymerase sigma-70 factor (ECF subfamily)